MTWKRLRDVALPGDGDAARLWNERLQRGCGLARYRKVDVRVWSDAKFRSLSSAPANAQTLWLYLITCPHPGLPGLFSAGEAALAEELGWSLEGFRKAFQEVSRKGLAKADWAARLVWLPNALKYHRPENPNVVKSWATWVDELPECALKGEALRSIKAFVEGMSEPFVKALPEGFAKGLAIQEQEQEQEQEQDERCGPPRVLEFPLNDPRTPTSEKQQSVWVRAYVEMQQARRKRLEELELDAADEAPDWAFVSAKLKRIADALGDDTERLFELWDDYLAEDWPAKKFPDGRPPYSFQSFVSEKVWRKYLAGGAAEATP